MGRGGKRKHKAPQAAAAAAAVAPVNDDVPPVGSEAGSDGDWMPAQPPSVEAASGGEVTTGSEERRGFSPERDGEGEVNKLKALNSALVTEAMEERGLVAARADEQSDEASVLAGTEDVVFRAAIEGPFLDAAEESQLLHERVKTVEKSLEAAQARAVREAGARGEAAVLLEAAEVEKRRVLELLAAKHAEAVAASKNVAQLEASVHHLEGKTTELTSERAEMEKKLGEISISARLLQAQKEDVDESFKIFKEKTEMYKQDMAEKLKDKLGEVQALKSEKSVTESRLKSLEIDLPAALSWNPRLEMELETSNTELTAARSEAEKLRLEVSEAMKKYSKMVAEVETLRDEIAQATTTKEAAFSAAADEKTKFVRELDGLKRKLDLIQANKDAAMGLIKQKDAEATKLMAELDKLHSSIAELRALCDEHDASSSSLQGEKDTVLKALGDAEAEGAKLRLRVGELESINGRKDLEIGVLKAEVEDRNIKIDCLNGKLELLQLAVAEAAQRSKKSGVWTWLCPATTTVIAAASFAYAARSR